MWSETIILYCGPFVDPGSLNLVEFDLAHSGFALLGTLDLLDYMAVMGHYQKLAKMKNT